MREYLFRNPPCLQSGLLLAQVPPFPPHLKIPPFLCSQLWRPSTPSGPRQLLTTKKTPAALLPVIGSLASWSTTSVPSQTSLQTSCPFVPTNQMFTVQGVAGCPTLSYSVSLRLSHSVPTAFRGFGRTVCRGMLVKMLSVLGQQ